MAASTLCLLSLLGAVTHVTVLYESKMEVVRKWTGGEAGARTLLVPAPSAELVLPGVLLVGSVRAVRLEDIAHVTVAAVRYRFERGEAAGPMVPVRWIPPEGPRLPLVGYAQRSDGEIPSVAFAVVTVAH